LATIGHIAAGIAIARAGTGGRDYLGLVVVTAAAVSPDIDLVFAMNHRGATHSVGFAVVVAVASGVLLRTVNHRRPRHIALLAFVSVLSHILLDFLTVASPIAALWPITSTEFKFPYPFLPSVPLDERIRSVAGLRTAAAEVAWSIGLVAAGMWIGFRHRGVGTGGTEAS
jgi:inner membrane protein